jgi:preprotein translocase subunit YajC
MLAVLTLLAENNDKGQESPFGALGMFLPLILILVLFFFLIILPARRRERQHRENVLNVMKKNDKVLTNSGIIGVVANIKDDEITLKLEEGKMRVLRSTILKIYGPDEPVKDSKQETRIQESK